MLFSRLKVNCALGGTYIAPIVRLIFDCIFINEISGYVSLGEYMKFYLFINYNSNAAGIVTR